jgi:hypothetical protein
LPESNQFQPESSLLRAGQWMLQSGIQERSGGVARYYNAAEARNLPVSTEITGYAASTFAFLYERTGDLRYLSAAVRAQQFLTRDAWIESLRIFPFETGPESPAYFFDCGIIIRGLLAVWRLTRDQEPLDAAYACARSMGRDFLGNRAIHPVISLPGREPLPYEKRWSREPGCFLLKSALAWRDLAAITSDSRFLEWWEHALEFAVSNDPEFLPGDEDRSRVMDRLHAYSYYLEALLVTGRGSLLCAGLARTAKLLREIAPEFARADVYAQILRVRLLADELALVPMDRAAASEEAAVIPGYQYRSEDTRLDGGYCFGSRSQRMLPYANPVSTGFCLQALEWWSDYQGGSFEATLDQLI